MGKLFQSADRAEAHAKLAEVIADGSAPDACCTEHSNLGIVVVWDGTPSAVELERIQD